MIQYKTMQYHTRQYKKNTIQDETRQDTTRQDKTGQYNTIQIQIQNNARQNNTTQYYQMQSNTHANTNTNSNPKQYKTIQHNTIHSNVIRHTYKYEYKYNCKYNTIHYITMQDKTRQYNKQPFLLKPPVPGRSVLLCVACSLVAAASNKVLVGVPDPSVSPAFTGGRAGRPVPRHPPLRSAPHGVLSPLHGPRCVELPPRRTLS